MCCVAQFTDKKSRDAYLKKQIKTLSMTLAEKKKQLTKLNGQMKRYA